MPASDAVTSRAAGILLHPASLPGGWGVGDLGEPSRRFLDWLEEAGQSVWQVLPLGPTGMGNSPYSTLSSFAGNPLLISLDDLAAEGVLLPKSLDDGAPRASDRIDYPRVLAAKERLLRESWETFRSRPPAELARAHAAYLQAPEQAGWLADWALFSTLKAREGGRLWSEWPRELRDREPAALETARTGQADEIAYRAYLQFLFQRQWDALKDDANRRGIRIFGDIPIYMALDSAEVWSSRELFELDEAGRPMKVAGVPPDYFSETGQLWGNPTYRWRRLAETGYAWWIQRLRASLRRVDLLRLDHFRGFAGYWEVDAAETTAIRGAWRPGPGIELFRAARRALGDLPLVAEDLGVITPDVERLRRDLGLPGMKVLQFGFGEIDGDHLPHNVCRRTVFYTGTHDNDTAVGWFAGLGEDERGRVRDYLGSNGGEIAWDMIRAVATSRAGLSMVPMQDVLGLGSAARLNTPGVARGNWDWRLTAGQASPTLAARLRRTTELAGRLPGARSTQGDGGTDPAGADSPTRSA